MKVLEKGMWDNPWSLEAICSEKSCGAKLMIEESDMKPVDNYVRYYASCVVCGHKISVASESLPLRLRNILDKERKYSSCGGWD